MYDMSTVEARCGGGGYRDVGAFVAAEWSGPILELR